MTHVIAPQDMFSNVVQAIENLGVDGIEITPATVLREDLDIDSAELVELVTDIAGSAPDGKALKHVRTVAELISFLADTLAVRSSESGGAS